MKRGILAHFPLRVAIVAISTLEQVSAYPQGTHYRVTRNLNVKVGYLTLSTVQFGRTASWQVTGVQKYPEEGGTKIVINKGFKKIQIYQRQRGRC